MTSNVNPFLGYLDEEPRAAYFSYGKRFGGLNQSGRQEKFFTNQFSDIYNQYLGSLGARIKAGTTPTGNFNDYLAGFDFENWYRKQVPYEQRNQGFSDLVPSLSWRIPGVNV